MQSPLDVRPAGAGPVTAAERITSIDVLRGFAVLGILLMNMQSFAMVSAAYVNPTAYGDLTGANYAVWLLSHLFADRKLITIFSMLFGAGIVLMSERREAAGLRPASVHYRRMVVLLILMVATGVVVDRFSYLPVFAAAGLMPILALLSVFALVRKIERIEV